MSDAYKEGREAFAKGWTVGRNPYEEPAEEHPRWAAGWEDAKIDQELDRSKTCTDRTE